MLQADTEQTGIILRASLAPPVDPPDQVRHLPNQVPSPGNRR
jgi:hypothetical protein